MNIDIKTIRANLNSIKYEKLRILIIVLFIVAINTLINICYSENSIIYGIKFILFEIFLFFLPGLAISCLLKWKNLSNIEVVATSSIFGYSTNILMYFIHMILKVPIILVNIITIVISIYIIYKNYSYINNLKNEKKENNYIYVCFILVLLIMQFFLFFNLNQLPYIGNGNEYYGDFLYWIGDANELSIQFPPTHFRDPGQLYRYHYFTAIQLSYSNMVIQIGIAKLVFVLSYINPIIMLVSTTFLLLKRATDSNFLLWFGVFILLLTTGYEGKTSVNWISHIYKCSFGLDISISYLMLSFAFSIDYINKIIDDEKYFIFQCILLFMTLGTKSVSGLCLMCILGFVYLYKIIKNKKRTKYFVFGISFLIIFILTYAFILSSLNNTAAKDLNSSSLVINWFNTTLFNNPNLAHLYTMLLNREIPLFLSQIITMFIYSLWCHFPIFIFFYCGTIFYIFQYKKIEYIDFFSFVITIIGLVSLFLFDHFQYSQMYFLLCVYPIASFFYIRFLEQIRKQLIIKKIKKLVLISFFAVYASYGTYIFSQQYFFKDYFKNGINIFLNPSSLIIDPSVENHNLQPVSKEEYFAYEWLRMNTDIEDRLLSNFVDSGFLRNYALGAFSERHVILNKELMDIIENRSINGLTKLHENNIDYIVITKWIYETEISPDIAKKVYSNSEVVIYEVN